MSSTGGDLLEIKINHPVLGALTLFAKANEDGQFDLGGFRNNDDANMVDGSGANIKQLNRVRWKIETTVAWDMNTREDLTKLVAIAGSPLDSDCIISHINGTVWKGLGAPVGDVSGNSNNATFPLVLSGGGQLVKII